MVLQAVFTLFNNTFLILNDLPASWVQKVLPSHFQTQQHRQGPVFPRGEKREYHRILAWRYCMLNSRTVYTYRMRVCAGMSSGKAGQYRCRWCCRWKLLHHPGTHLEHHPLLPGNHTFFNPSSYLKPLHPFSSVLWVSIHPPFLHLSFHSNEVKCNNKVSASQPVHFPFTKVHQSAARLVVYVIHTAVQCLGQTPWGNNYLHSSHRLSSNSRGILLYEAAYTGRSELG